MEIRVILISVVLPNEVVAKLVAKKVEHPYYFRVTNTQKRIKLHCGVLEFSAPKGQCYLPFWVYINKMMKVLQLNEGDSALITAMKPQKGSYLQIQPHEKAFIELANPKAVS